MSDKLDEVETKCSECGHVFGISGLKRFFKCPKCDELQVVDKHLYEKLSQIKHPASDSVMKRALAVAGNYRSNKASCETG